MEGRLTLSNNAAAHAPAGDGLMVDMKHRMGAVSLDVRFALTQPWTVLFGPSGSGKTTLLRSIAGFVRPDAGRIVSGAEVLFDAAAKVFVPAHKRPVRCAGQTARLFPHKTVRWNLVYGNGWSSKPADAMDVVEQFMASFRLKGLADRMPGDLSGGERQRAVVARAVVAAVTFKGPGTPLLLLDEPFSGLDIAMRDELLVELQEWVKKWKIPVLSVTHDVGEAFQLEAEVIKLADGRVVQQGPATEVLIEERRRLMKQLGRESAVSKT
jgi:molybdate transport system ATP-binding protein